MSSLASMFDKMFKTKTSKKGVSTKGKKSKKSKKSKTKRRKQRGG